MCENIGHRTNQDCYPKRVTGKNVREMKNKAFQLLEKAFKTQLRLPNRFNHLIIEMLPSTFKARNEFFPFRVFFSLCVKESKVESKLGEVDKKEELYMIRGKNSEV